MSDVRVIIQRDSEREERVVTTGTTAAELFAGERSIIAARVSGDLKDLAYEVRDGETVEGVEISSEDGLNILRHSTAHVMAQAVQELFPEAKLGIGPPVKDGFYYDFDVEKPFHPDDLKAIEKKMQEIQKRGQRFSRRVVTDEAAREELADEPYKLELIGLKGSASHDDGADVEVGAGELTIYDNLDAKTGELCWRDLCRGPHLPSTRNIPAFKLMRNAAAYWRGSEKNPMLQRIYGTAWPTKDELKAHLEFLAEAEKRDHRKLGNELDLFSIPEQIGSGLAVFHPKGGIIRRVMEDYSRRRHEEEGYEFVYTPHATKGKLFETSGHLDWYADGMYPPMQLDEGVDYYLKPMNCPMHNLIFDARGRSYRELPLRLFEFGTVYRYEKSGVVHGLTRARGFTQDDAHIYCTREQMSEELDKTLTFVLNLLRDYGLNDFYLELSTKDPEKFVGTDEALGRGHRDAAPGRREAEPGTGGGPGRCRVLRPEDLRPGQGRHRAHLADVDHPARLQPAGALRPGVHGRGRFQDPPRHDPPRAVRLHRALLRGAPGALRGRDAAVARSGAGGGHPGGRRSRAVPGGVRGGGTAQGAACRRGRLLGPDAEEDPHAAEAEGPVHDHRRRRGHARRHGVVPLPRRVAGERHPA